MPTNPTKPDDAKLPSGSEPDPGDRPHRARSAEEDVPEVQFGEDPGTIGRDDRDTEEP